MPTGSPLTDAIKQQPKLPLWLTHLWQRASEHRRLGLILGAGVSFDAKVPLWGKLVSRLAEAAGISAEILAQHQKERFPETFLAEILYRHHHADHPKSADNPSDRYHEYRVNSAWKQKIRECLYRDVGDKTFEEIAKKHPYLKGLANLVCKSGFTVTLNFDDIVDQAVTAHVEEILTAAPETDIANPEIIYHPKVETRKHAPVIYHINGSLPRDQPRRSSAHVVLTEDAFADVMLSPNSHNAEYVINQFAVRTFVLLGLSLNDNSLKNILRSSAKRNPANHHFIILHELDDNPRSAAVRSDIFEVNLHVYNLITIFLTTAQHAQFIDVLNASSAAQFDEMLLALGAQSTIHRKYYIVGSVASGKSSTVDALRCFTTFEEFSGRVPKEMYRDDTGLTQDEQKIVDNYLFPRLIEKNRNMMRPNSGVRVMDRAFLDLFAFSKNGDKIEIKRKALELKTRIEQYKKPFEDGHLFFLSASSDALEERLLQRSSSKEADGKFGFELETLKKQDKVLRQIYRIKDDQVLDTSHLTTGEVAKAIARKILLDDYEEFPFAERLGEIIDGDGAL
ncbi:SIR2 family protein [Bradyrhizobium sp. WD16]|uniref:SIR2 family protein n=1 Tax=Bradyrhizobium sp. WD16 TaxID=1521768 RepID=UPI0020A27362|nr:SIR2 family protein [Bradyrhizobium sp. WD16]UTD26624.1 hypothetical protein DB459_06490 [Bradyrhizobium sp. WD16]